jgi:hypothetical protein
MNILNQVRKKSRLDTPTAHVLERKLLEEMTLDAKTSLQKVAKKLRVQFVYQPWDRRAYFEVSNRSDDYVRLKRTKIVEELKSRGLGDSRGVYSGRDWLHAEIISSGLDIEELRDLLNDKRERIQLYEWEVIGADRNLYICATHNRNSHDSIEFFFEQETNDFRIQISCEDRSQLRLLLAYVVGFLSYHFSKTIGNVNVKLETGPYRPGHAA